MAHPCSCLYYRQGGILPYKFYKIAAASWDNHIHILLCREELRGSLTGRGQEGAERLRKGESAKFSADYIRNCLAGEGCIRAGFKHCHISGTQAEREDICSNVWSCLIYHSHHSKRNAYLVYYHTVWPLDGLQHPPSRGRQFCNTVHI